MRLLLFASMTALFGCTSVPIAEYRSAYPAQTFESKVPYETLFMNLKNKMQLCYGQIQAEEGFSGVSEKTESTLSKDGRRGTVFHAVDSILGRNILYLIDVTPSASGSVVTLHAKGDGFRTTGELVENLKKWVAGEKGKCRGRGEV